MYRGPQTKRLKHYADVCGELPRLSWEEAVQEATGVETDDIATAARESNTTVEVHPRDGPVEQHEGAAAVEKSIVEMEKDRFVVVPKNVAPAPRENRVVYDSCSPVLMNVNFNEELGTAVLEYEMRPEHFEQRIQELKDFYAEHGEPPKKNKNCRNELSLWAWIQTRRSEKRKGILSLEKIERIETLFKDWWSWGFHDEFEKRIQEVDNFYKKYGEPPKPNGKRGNEPSLWLWLQSRRNAKRKGVLTAERIQRIETVFKDWWRSWDPKLDSFEIKIKEIDDFYKKYGEPPKQYGKRGNEPSLWLWLQSRRTEKRKGVLTAERIERIETVFKDWWSWDPIADAFEEKIQEVDTFFNTYGEPPKRKGNRGNEHSLYSWNHRRREEKRNGKLTSEKIQRIETVFQDWWSWGKTSDAASVSMDEDTASITEDGADLSLDSVDFAPPAEPEPEERREKRPRDDGLDGMDKDALIAMIREQKRGREGGGYTAPNPVNKDEINTLFSRSLPRHRGAVLFLDHTDFKTARALQAAGVDPRDMIIPQRDRATFDTMRRDPVFGPSVVDGDFNGILSLQTMPIRGIYADFTGPLKEAEGLIEACRDIHFVPLAVVAVTITLRNPEGGAEHVNQDIVKLSGMLNRELETIAIDDPETGKTIWSLAYGHGAPMATVIQHRRN